MEGKKGMSTAERIVERRIARHGLRPRVAASVIAVIWIAAIAVFGVVEHLVDPKSFDNIWLGMWWATQTVTTVGYGDAVPNQAGGQVIASILMIGGLSFFAVLTGMITSLFVARQRQQGEKHAPDEVLARLDEIGAELKQIKHRLDDRT
jgi:voltage-gated potassium channel